MVSLEYDSERSHLHKDYRNSDEATPEFRYFAERILAAVDPRRNKFKDKKGMKPLREIYTVTDEAFGLLILLNELHCWEAVADKEPGAKFVRKKFCDAKSGSKNGWSEKGLRVYNRICKNLRTRRCEEQSIRLESNMYKAYSREFGGNYDYVVLDEIDISDAESMYQDDTILEVTERIHKSKEKPK